MNPQVISRNVHLMPLDFGMSDDHGPGFNLSNVFSKTVEPTTLPKFDMEPENDGNSKRNFRASRDF